MSSEPYKLSEGWRWVGLGESRKAKSTLKILRRTEKDIEEMKQALLNRVFRGSYQANEGYGNTRLKILISN